MPAFLAAQLAKPAVKWGIIAGSVVSILLSVWFHGLSTGTRLTQKKCDAALAVASNNAIREAVKAEAMEAQVVKSHLEQERIIEAKADQIKKEVVHHAKKNSKPLSVATVAIYDRLVGLPNESGLDLPTTDSRARTPEISRGGLAAQATARIQDEAGHDVELTTEELAQAAVDFAEKYANMKNQYQALSVWNDGRERLELQRLQDE